LSLFKECYEKCQWEIFKKDFQIPDLIQLEAKLQLKRKMNSTFSRETLKFQAILAKKDSLDLIDWNVVKENWFSGV